MTEIAWRKEGDDYFGVEPETHRFDAMTWRVDAGRRVAFRVPAEPPYFTSSFSTATDAAVLASLDLHLQGEPAP